MFFLQYIGLRGADSFLGILAILALYLGIIAFNPPLSRGDEVKTQSPTQAFFSGVGMVGMITLIVFFINRLWFLPFSLFNPGDYSLSTFPARWATTICAIWIALGLSLGVFSVLKQNWFFNIGSLMLLTTILGWRPLNFLIFHGVGVESELTPLSCIETVLALLNASLFTGWACHAGYMIGKSYQAEYETDLEKDEADPN